MDLKNNFDKDFITACNLTEQSFSHEDLIEMLRNGGIPEKQFAALNLDCINDEKEGKILVDNLTGCDGKIREATALKINQLLKSGAESVSQYIYTYPEVFANASVDINANICRLVIDSVSILKKEKQFAQVYLDIIINFIDECFTEIDKFIFRDKKYVINKQLFKLYWCLESLKLFTEDIPANILLKILERASLEKEYTIREKVAQVLVLAKNNVFNPLINKLKNDDNYYVRTVFK